MNTTLIARKALPYNRATISALLLMHSLGIAALFFLNIKAVLVGLVVLWVAGSLGIGIGYHRLLTHRGFVTPKWLEYVLVTFGALAVQGGPIQWVATHRIHHANTDVEGDPHSPRHGKWWSHMGWIIRGTAQQHDQATLQRYVPDLLRDRYYVALSRFFYMPQVILGLTLLFISGFPMVLTVIFLRVLVGWHVTWAVNSVTHVWGTRRFETRDDSTNQWLVGVFAFGEGWHNNHHAYPTSARHGLTWYELDINWICIRALQLVGLARKVKTIKLSELNLERADEVLRKAA
jgi:sn-1 stearoyl-lipid 9-desaturase